MSYTKETTIWCDGEGCDEFECLGYPRVKETRAMLKRKQGWTYRDGKDYCPKCSKNNGN